MSGLFMVMLGGRHARANTEVHDVVIAAGETLEETYPQLRNAWFGEPKGLHIDAWAKFDGVSAAGQNYRIHFSNAQPSADAVKLWLINLGGYDASCFGELHCYILAAAQTAADAKQQGKMHFEAEWQKQHTDRVLDVDDCIAIDCIHGRYIHLSAGDFAPVRWENCYITIG